MSHVICHSRVENAGYCLGQLRTAIQEASQPATGPSGFAFSQGPLGHGTYSIGRHGQCIILSEHGKKALAELAHLTRSCPDNRHLLRTLTPDDLRMLRLNFGCEPFAQAVLRGVRNRQLALGALILLGVTTAASVGYLALREVSGYSPCKADQIDPRVRYRQLRQLVQSGSGAGTFSNDPEALNSFYSSRPRLNADSDIRAHEEARSALRMVSPPPPPPGGR